MKTFFGTWKSIFPVSKFQQQSALPNKWPFFSHGARWRGILMLDQNTRLSMMPGSFATKSNPTLFLFQRGQDHKTPKICTASKSESRHNKWPWMSKSVVAFGPHFRDRGHLHPARQHHRSVVFSATAFLLRKTTSGQLWSKKTRFLSEQCQKPLKKIFHCIKSDNSSPWGGSHSVSRHLEACNSWRNQIHICLQIPTILKPLETMGSRIRHLTH